ncbi:MAG: MBOAT family protein [Bacteroidales bacterium]|nr:MBOAT family protein [Bacteroidales bacterium]
MQITSLYFILLSIISVFIYYQLNHRYRALFLTLLSCGFIATYSYILLIYVVAYASINYVIGLKIPDSKSKKSLFITGLVINLTQLILLKYVSFTLNPLLQVLQVDLDLSIISRIIIPVGVSFFTMQGIGYLVNIKMGWEKPEKDFTQFLLYLIFFPRFLSGPVDRSNHFLPQLKENQVFNEQKVIDGLRLILFGLFKKVAIANQLAPVVLGAYADLGSEDTSSLLIVLLIQPIYIYFDFSGYTDIAFGVARLFGLELRPNFKRPFLAETVTDFWKRFHISLASWFHDYVYMRTFFKYRKWGKNATTFALFVTWLLFGIWHGAGWTFMLLGLMQALAIYYEFSTRRWRNKVFAKMPKAPKILMGRILTYLFYGVSLVFFFAPDLNSVYLFFSKLFPVEGYIPMGIRNEIYLLVMFFVLVLMAFEILQNDFGKVFSKIEGIWLGKKGGSIVFRWALYLLIITVVIVFNRDVQQFIYFQF